MKYLDHDFKDAETGITTTRKCVQFYNRAIWRVEKYNAINKRRLFRRNVINKFYQLVKG